MTDQTSAGPTSADQTSADQTSAGQTGAGQTGAGQTGSPAAVGDFADASLAELGRQRIAWADSHMPVLASIRARFEKERPLEGVTVGACLHITTETANLLRTLKAGG
ncbi:MAG TPA: adenosylhomocysteinase, partial [Acidimicrobiales bacterium]|nr:adenosylhomocysteinase [Acidimicrobiales bacterium]